jgi:hypothetical protein
MLLNELTERSPVRAIENAIHGGLGTGNLGVILSRPGVGKTACLVQIGVDAALRARNVLHVALGHTVARVRDWYTEIFKDMAAAYKLEDSIHCLLDLERHRRIHTYLGHTFAIPKLKDIVRFMATHSQFEPRVILIDGMDLPAASLDDVQELKSLAADIGAEVWMSGVSRRADPGYYGNAIPEPYRGIAPLVSVFLKLESLNGTVSLRIVKEHDQPELPELHLKLHPQSMLIVEE